MTQITTTALKVPRQYSPALDTGNYKVLRCSLLDYTVLAHQERETGELTFRLLPIAEMVSVPKAKQVAVRTLAAPKTMGIAHISAFCRLIDHIGYNVIWYARAAQTNLR